MNRMVAVKILHPKLTNRKDLVSRFRREARAMSHLTHPNTVKVYLYGDLDDGSLYIVMEYLEGKNLNQVVRKEGPLGIERAIPVLIQVCGALHEAHLQGIIHRDLKPENVMVEARRDEPDFVKVLDFGIAKISTGAEEPKLTAVGLVCGTPEYMSPEQARGANLDPRSDLYSVGVIFYQMATGDLPFHSDTPVGFLTKHLAELPLAPRQLRPDLSKRLDALIRRAMEKDPANRYPDAVAMREALLACAGPATIAVPVMVPPSGATLDVDIAELGQAAPSPVSTTRRRLPLVAAGLAVVVAVAVAALVAGGRRSPRVAPAVTAHAPPAAAVVPVTEPSVVPPPPTAEASEPVPAPARPRAPAAAPTLDRPVKAGPVKRLHAHDLVKRGDALRSSGDTDGAIRAYLAAEAADPALPAIQKKLAICYQQQGDTRSAKDRYRRYLASDPPDAARVRLILDTIR
jgi:serine/threonine-protein kinase